MYTHTQKKAVFLSRCTVFCERKKGVGVREKAREEEDGKIQGEGLTEKKKSKKNRNRETKGRKDGCR